MKLENCIVFVTGGSSGLGAGCVTFFTQKGAKVAIADINIEAGQALANKTSALFIETDVTSRASIQNAIDTTRQTYGNLNVVINCAGIAPVQKTVRRNHESHDIDLFNKVIQINLIGSFSVSSLAAASIIESASHSNEERGVIIHTASVAALEGQMGQVAYSASKGGIVGMTLPMARDLAKHGIRVATIAPGIFDTPMLRQLPEKAQASLITQVPYPNRLGDPLEFASLAAQIVENPMHNGNITRLDGALRMGMI